MECNYEPYIQITGTTSFPRLRSSPLTKRRELESLFQQERSDKNLSSNPWNKYFQGNDAKENGVGERAEGGRGNNRQTMMTPNEAASRAFHERYSHLTPGAFCVSGPDGSNSLCLNRKEYEAIVERSRNKQSDCVFLLRSASRCSGGDQDLWNGEGCPAQAPSTADCRCRGKWNRPTSPVYKAEGSCRGGKPLRRANACATKARRKEEKKKCSNCPRGSCGKPIDCSPQAYKKTPRPRRSSKPCDGRLRSGEYSCQCSKINPGSWCCYCSDICDRMTSGCGRNNRLSDGCRPTAGDRLTGRCSEISRGNHTNCDNLLPSIYCSDPCRTMLRPINLEACNGGRPTCGYNVYEVRSIDCAKTNDNGPFYGSADEKKFRLSAM